MSEQNPPSGQSTPPPDEPTQPIEPSEEAGTTASEEAAPTTPPAGESVEPGDEVTPPPPGTPDETAVGGDNPPPPPPAHKSRSRWIIGVAALLVLVLVGAGAFFIVRSVTAEDTHSIATPASAGGMKRDTAQEKKLKSQLDATAKQFESQFKGVSVKHALYNQDNTDRGPKGPLLFLGLKFKTASEKNPADFAKQFDKVAAANKLKVTKISAGDGDGRAFCVGSDPSASATCLWVTRDSAGGVFPNVGGFKTDQLAKLMRDVRADVETTD